MKKFTHLSSLMLLCLLWGYGGLQAQSWQRVGDDSTAFNLVTDNFGITLVLDDKGQPDMFYTDNTAGGNLTGRKFNGSAWSLIGSPGFAVNKIGANFGTAFGGVIWASPSTGNSFPSVYKYSGADWVRTPASQYLGTGTGSPPGMAVDKTGKAYYALYDNGTHNPVVYTYDGSQWTEVGAGQLGNASGGQMTELAVDSHNNLYILYDEANSDPYGNPTLIVAKFDGSNWVQLGTTPLFSVTSYHCIAFDNQDNPYIVVSAGRAYAPGFNFKVVKLSGGDWVDVGGNISPVNGTGFSIPAGRGGGNLAEIYLAMGPHNTPLVAWYESYNLLTDPNSGQQTGPQQILVNNFDGVNWVSVSDTAVYSAPLDQYGRPLADPIDGNDIAFAADTLGNVFVGYSVNTVMNIKKLAAALPSDTITFADITKTYGAADFAPAAASTNTSKTNPIIYAIADPTIAAIIGGKIHILQAGSTTITASQTADATYAAAVPVQRNLVIDKAPQTISFPSLGSNALTDPDSDPGATASSALPVTYTSSDPTIATIINGKIHKLQSGTVIITAHQPGNTDYLAAKDSSQSLVVYSIVTTVITWSDLVKTYGDGDFGTGATSNNPVPIVYAIGDPTIAQFVSGKIHILKAGQTTLAASQPADNHHTAASVQVNLVIDKASQSIQFPPFAFKTILDGDFPAGGVAVSGSGNNPTGLPVTYTSSDPAIATVANGIVHLLQAGTIIITAQQAGDDNYLAAPDAHNALSIIKDSQSIIFEPLPAKMLGDADFNPGATASSGLLVTYTSGDPSVVTVINDQLHIVKVGAVVITAHQPGNDKYQDANDVNQVLTINPGANRPFPAGDSLIAYCSSATTLQINVFSLGDQQASLQLFDLYGQRVFNQEISIAGQLTNPFIIPVGNVPAGIYTVRIAGPHIRLTQKVKINK